MKPLIHIGPPKTGSTSLQKFLIPQLGRPFEIWPAWARALARKKTFDAPAALPKNFILSGEGLGDFVIFPPTVIADRLSHVFSDATVIWVHRNPLDHFYSWY